MSTTTQSRTLLAIAKPIPYASETLNQVRLFFAAKGDAAAQMTVDEIAQGANVSKSSVVRFCKHHGFKGYKELRQQLIGEILTKDNAREKSGEVGASRDDFFDAVLQEHLSSLLDTAQTIDRDAFNQAAERVAESSLCVWYGIGESGALAQAADYKCLLGGINSKVAAEHTTFRYMGQHLTAKDTVICISRSGRPGAMYQTLRAFRKENAAKVIGIIGNAGSPIAELSDLALISAPRDTHCSGHIITWHTPQLLIIDAIIASALSRRFPDKLCLPWQLPGA